MKIMTSILVLLLLALSLFSLAVSIVGNHAIDVAANQDANPSATDIIMQSRLTPAVTADRSSAAWLGAGLLALILLGMGAVVFTMKGGTDLLKQWRLALKKPGHRPMSPLPHVPYSPPLREIPNVPTARQLPEVNEYEQQDFDYPYPG